MNTNYKEVKTNIANTAKRTDSQHYFDVYSILWGLDWTEADVDDVWNPGERGGREGAEL